MASAEQDNFSNISWHHDSGSSAHNPGATASMAMASDGTVEDLGDESLSRLDQAGLGPETLVCTVTSPMKENDGTKDAFVSYLIATQTTFPSFQKPTTSVRRRFTDFVFLYKSLCRDYIACAVPPLPAKERMEYVRGDRFGSDFTGRRANSLQRFLNRISLHPILRRADILHIFLESAEWNATMRTRSTRVSMASDPGSGGVFDNFADTFINAFTKVHKPDKRFIEVREKSDKLDEDLSHVEKVVVRVARREADIETDLKDLAEQFQKLILLEPGIESSVIAFAASVEDMSSSLKKLRDMTDQDYLGHLRDMQAYSFAMKSLLKAREQKQLDFEQLTEYLNKSTADRDQLQSGHYGSSGGLTGASGFIRSKIEDVRGVDHEQSRRERQRKLELRIEELTREVETAKRTSAMFNDEVVREVSDFERIKRVEMKQEFSELADSHIDHYSSVIDIWEKYLQDMGTKVDTPTQ